MTGPAGGQRGEVLPVEEVARYPAPGTAVPASAAFSADGRWLAWLHSPERTLRRDLFLHDISTGVTRRLDPPGAGVTEENLTLEERLRRERARELGQGITSFAWSEHGARLMVPLPDGVWVRSGGDGDWRLAVTAAGGPVLDPQLSPDGTKIAYVHGDELWVAGAGDHEASSSRPAPLTTGAAGTGRTHGLAEFVAQEEMDRDHGFWWSPDGRWLAYQETDETHIPLFRIGHLGSDDPGLVEEHRYPFAGADNARVRLFAVEAAGGEPVELDLGGAEYLARVHWTTDGGVLAELVDRSQTRLELVRFEIPSGERRTLLTEVSDVWVNLHDHFRPLAEGRFLWASEASGFRHLEVRTRDGALERPLTEGPWLVTAVHAVDEEAGLVWCSTTRRSPRERHLEAVPLDGGPARPLTTESGTHGIAVGRAAGLFLDTFSSVRRVPTVSLRALDDGSVRRVLFDEPDPRVEALAGRLPPPELLTVPGADGTELHAALWRPAGDPPWPTVISVYGGPHAQLVTDAWTSTVRMRNQLLRSLGFLVAQVDNRGSANRGLAFEGAIRWDAGRAEVDDQVALVRWLTGEGLANPDRVGIYGWSYGGYMAALCLARAPDVFRAGVAGAPVTHWDGYDTFYTERYMGTPQDNPEGYERSAVMTHAAGIRGPLLLVHGLVDENVHFRHTARLINALIRHRVAYELLLYPDERHSPRSEADRVHMEERIRDFLVAHLRS